MRFHPIIESEHNTCGLINFGDYLELVIGLRSCILNLSFEDPFAIVFVVDLEKERASEWPV